MSTWKLFVKSLRMMDKRMPLYLLAIIMMTTLGALFDVAGSVFMKKIFEYAALGTTEGLGAELMVIILAAVVAIALASVFMNIYNNEAKRASVVLKKKVFAKSMVLPMKYYDEHHSGELLSKLVYDSDRASDIYTSRLRRVLAPIISVIVFVIAMIAINPFMAAVLLLINIGLFIVNSLLSKPVKIAGKEMSIKNAKMTEELSNIISGIVISKIYDVEHISTLNYKKANESYASAQKRKMKMAALLESFNNGFDLLCALMFVVIGIALVQSQVASLGEIAAIYTLYTIVSFRFLQLGKNYPELMNCIAYAGRIFDFLDEAEEGSMKGNTNKENKNKENIHKENTNGKGREKNNDGQVETNAVVIENICFGYSNERPIFSDFSISISNNKLTAISGESGCGKSTLAKLIIGYYPIESGEIIVKGKSLRRAGLDAVRKLISYVPQEPYLYGVSIMENIRYGNYMASDSEVIKAAKIANADEFISKLENGYNTIVSNRGNSLSGGQRQRIAIARAVLKDAPILIMDEATSALDNESEKCISDALKKLRIDKTIIMIAHRQTTLDQSDCVIHM